MTIKNSKIPVFIWAILLAVFIILSWLHDLFFIDKLIICGLITGIIFFIRLKGDTVKTHSTTKVRKQ